MPVQDQSGRWIDVGSVVNIPGVVTAIGGTNAVPTVTIQTKYAATDDDTDSVGPVEACQVLEDF